MRRKIKRRMYDTSLAHVMTKFEHGTGDYWFKEELYRKRNGEFFLYGTGNSMSRYGTGTPGSQKVGEKLIPLTYEGAEEWVKANMPDDYDGIFGAVPATGERMCLSIYADKGKLEEVRRRAYKAGKSIGEYMMDCALKD